MKSRSASVRSAVVLGSLLLLASACSGDETSTRGDGGSGGGAASTTQPTGGGSTSGGGDMGAGGGATGSGGAAVSSSTSTSSSSSSSTSTSSSSASSSSSSGGGTGEPAELAGILQAHNDARAAEGVGLPPLTWDPALAAIAQAWADKCTDVKTPLGLIDHNANRSDTYPEYVGENIYGTSGTATGPGAVASWMNEKPNYDYATNKCALGKMCGHYTQVIWKQTTKLGCALSTCSGLKYKSSVVCDYAPGGNYNGEKPY